MSLHEGFRRGGGNLLARASLKKTKGKRKSSPPPAAVDGGGQGVPHLPRRARAAQTAAAPVQVRGVDPLRAPGVPRHVACAHAQCALRAMPPALHLFSSVRAKRARRPVGARVCSWRRPHRLQKSGAGAAHPGGADPLDPLPPDRHLLDLPALSAALAEWAGCRALAPDAAPGANGRLDARRVAVTARYRGLSSSVRPP